MTTITMIIYYIIGKFMSLGFFSFMANLFLLILIKKNIFGSRIKILVEDIPKSKKNAGLSALSKIGIVIGGGTGGYTSYQVIKRTSSYWGENTELVLNGNLRLNNVVVNTTGNYLNIPLHPVLNFFIWYERWC